MDRCQCLPCRRSGTTAAFWRPTIPRCPSRPMACFAYNDAKPRQSTSGGAIPCTPQQCPTQSQRPNADASAIKPPALAPTQLRHHRSPRGCFEDTPTSTATSASSARPKMSPPPPPLDTAHAYNTTITTTALPPSTSGSAAAEAAAATTAAAMANPWAGGLSPEVLQRYSLSAIQHRQLDVYLDHLLEVNQSMNLTAVREKGDAWQRHVMDSLALLPVIERWWAKAEAAEAAVPRGDEGTTATAVTEATTTIATLRGPRQPSLRCGHVSSSNSSGVSSSRGGGNDDGNSSSEGMQGLIRSSNSSSTNAGAHGSGSVASASGSLRLVDVGTGAGLPGMVLAVARPQWKVTLLDSLRKRCDFLREAAVRAGLHNVEVVWCRAEDGGRRPELREAYDIAVARAVAEARVLAELCLPFVRVGGLWVAAKGPDPEAEMAAAGSAVRQLGGRQLVLERVDSYSVEGQRTALVVTKTRCTPAKFPRQAGTPNKKPL